MNSMKEFLEASDAVCIFPTEVTARFWRDWVVRNGIQTAVRFDSFLSWDTFLRKILKAEQNKRQADEHFRSAASWLLLNRIQNGEAPPLRYLIPPAYSSETGQFHRMITALLPKLESILRSFSEAAMPAELCADILQLNDSYGEILASQGYYEPAFEQDHTDLSGLDSSSTYVLFFPEIIVGYDRLKERLIKDERFPVVPSRELGSTGSTGKLPVLQNYSNSACELAAVMDWVEQLLCAGVHPEQIYLTVGDYDSWRPELEHEAFRRGIPFSFRQGLPASVHPGGRLFPDLAEACRQGWPLHIVKRLFLNRSYPWKDALSLRKIAEAGIERCCPGGYVSGNSEDPWHKTLRLEGDEQLLNLWKRFRSHVRRMTEETSPKAMRRTVFGFLDLWMDTDSMETDEFSLVFDHCLELGVSLWEACEAAGIETCGGLYALWMHHLKQSTYVPQPERTGVQVYPYGVSAGIRPEYHAAVNLTQEAVTLQQPAIPYFSEASLSRFSLTGEDPSPYVLEMYEHGGETMLISCSKETFSGYALPPSSFFSQERIAYCDAYYPNPYDQEHQWWAAQSGGAPLPRACYPLQKEGFSYALDTSFRKKGFDLLEKELGSGDREYQGVLERTLMRREAGYLRISPTSLDKFASCRFSWVFSQLLKIEAYQPVPPSIDPREEGSLMHACLDELFMQAVGKGSPFEQGKLSIYLRELKGILSGILDDAERNHPWMIPPVRRQLEVQLMRCFERCLEIEAEKFDQWICFETEKYISFKDEQRKFTASGRIDRISLSPDRDSYGIIDYKRSESSIGRMNYKDLDTPIPSYQLPFYAWLLERTGTCSLHPSAACFAAVREGKVKFAYDARMKDSNRSGTVTDMQQFRKLIEQTRSAAEQMTELIRAGDFTDTPDTEKCRSCFDRMLCRRRYHVRA